jgi:hypothetical protein
VVASILEKVFFQHVDDWQRRSAFLKKAGITDVTVGGSP